MNREMEERSNRHILNLMTQMTMTGLSANEIGCVLIPMMARSISSNQRPNTLTHDQHHHLKMHLATHGRSIHWVKSRPFSCLPKMSAFGGKADLNHGLAECLFLAKCGH